MILPALLASPLLGAALLSRAAGRWARAIHGAAASVTLALGLAVAWRAGAGEPLLALDGLLRADALSAWLVALISLVGAFAATEAPRYVPRTGPSTLYPLFHLFVFTMLLAVTTDDVGIMWVAVEGTTLASVFLVNFERTRASLEAAYKYLLICSVGIAIAFVGTVLLYLADVRQLGVEAHALRWSTLLGVAPGLPPRVVELAFVFVLVGYGTKAGLVPMHTWLPDAHSESPAPVSALMSGVLLSVGVYAVLRFKPIVDLAAGPDFARRLLVGLGLGFGGAWGTAGALLHIANHALAKSALFLLAGRIRAAYGSADIAAVGGLFRTMPSTARVFLAALLALLGLPPFGLFVSEVMIFGAGFREDQTLAATAGLGLLVIAFAGMLRAGHRMLYGAPTIEPPDERHGWAAPLPVLVALGLLVVSGIAWPPGLADTLTRIALVVAP